MINKILINKDLVMQRQAKINDKNRHFGVFMTPLPRRNKWRHEDTETSVLIVNFACL